jgi:hypothetical protein
MTQLLESEGPKSGIGLCQIGGLETENFKQLLDLDKHHVLLHGLLGGLIDEQREKQRQLSDMKPRSGTAAPDERDEGEI